MQQYLLIGKLGEGSFSEVLKAQSIKNKQIVAIKCMKANYESLEKVRAMQEIQTLQKCSTHPNIIKLIEVIYDEPTQKLALVFELMDMNLYELIKNRQSYLSPQRIKKYIYQVLRAVDFLHKKGIFHRDIKPENILVRNETVKVADLGSSKNSSLQHPYTEYISTRWYRAPECLMTDGYYSSKMDLWGIGTVLFEIIAMFPLFEGANEMDQIHKIFKILGTPDKEVIKRFMTHYTHMELNIKQVKGIGFDKLLPAHTPPECVDLLYKLLIIDPHKRISAEEALQHEFFREFWDVPKSVSPDLPRRPPPQRVYPGTIKLQFEEIFPPIARPPMKPKPLKSKPKYY